MNDALLIEKTLAGDRSAFGQLVRKYQDRLFNTLAHLVHVPQEAEDLVQEAFVQAYVKLETFRGQSAFYTWLYRIAFNLAISHLRRERSEMSIDQHQQQTGSEPVERADGPGEEALRAEEIRQVQEAIGRLSEQHRAIVVLRDIEGLDYETIAEILQIPPGTVRSRLHRARLALRNELKEFLAEQAAD